MNETSECLIWNPYRGIFRSESRHIDFIKLVFKYLVDISRVILWWLQLQTHAFRLTLLCKSLKILIVNKRFWHRTECICMQFWQSKKNQATQLTSYCKRVFSRRVCYSGAIRINSRQSFKDLNSNPCWNRSMDYTNGPRCGIENCKSKRFYYEDGLKFCKNGHQQEVCTLRFACAVFDLMLTSLRVK